MELYANKCNCLDLYNKSRVRGDFQARFCERFRVKLPLPTRSKTRWHPFRNCEKVITLFTLLLISNACSQNENFQNSLKKILVIGTSITEGCTYVKNASKANNYISYNKAIGSSGICLNSGILGNGRDGKDLSETVQEKILRYENKVDSLTLEKYKSYSWNSNVEFRKFLELSKMRNLKNTKLNSLRNFSLK